MLKLFGFVRQNEVAESGSETPLCFPTILLVGMSCTGLDRLQANSITSDVRSKSAAEAKSNVSRPKARESF